MDSIEQAISLPQPQQDGATSVEQTISQRRSVRRFTTQAINCRQFSQILWAAQGITHGDGLRTAPSAGALYPLELYAVVGNVTELGQGLYKYIPGGHRLVRLEEGDLRADFAAAALGQEWVGDNAALLILSAVERRTTRTYGRRGLRYVHIEAGHVAQNVFLQAGALGLGASVVGAFEDTRVAQLLSLPRGESPLCLMPVGHPLE